MKKCPECGNPSYDGAPVCGNCGYKFPKPKVVPSKSEDIFKQDPKEEKTSNDKSTTSIIREKKLVIGAILIITIIVICGIFLTGSNNSVNDNPGTPLEMTDLAEYSNKGFSFNYPSSWEEVNLTDDTHPGAIFFKNDDDVIIEYYNGTIDASSLKEITSERISYAQNNGDYVNLVETITLDGRNSSNIILENSDGNYTRYVSMFSDGEIYVFKVSGSSINSITSEEIEKTIHSADIA